MNSPDLSTVLHIFRYTSPSSYVIVVDSSLCPELPESCFDPYFIERGPDGELVVLDNDDLDGCVCKLPDIPNSGRCRHYISHLFAYLNERQISFGVFFGITVRDWTGELLEYYLLLVERYFQLLASAPQRLMNFEDDNDIGFLDKQDEAKILLSMLSLVSRDFTENPHILPILERVIDLFIEHFPDTLFMGILANFTESGIESLVLSEASQYSFHSKRMLQKLEGFKHFDISRQYFTHARFPGIFVLLLTNYCGEYSAQEFRTAILNVTAFVMQKLPNEAAKEALNDIFTGLGKQDEIFQSILEAILVIVRENLGRILESLKFPVHPDEILKRFSDYLAGDFAEQYKFFCKWAQQDYPRDKLKLFLKEKSEKFPVAGIIFARLFSKAFIERGQKLSDAFDEGISGIFQGVNEHSKLQSIECKESPEELHAQRRFLFSKFPEEVLISSGCGVKTSISAALEHLRLTRKKIHQDRQAEWRDGGVALQRWETRFDEDNLESLQQFKKYQNLTRDLNQIDSLIAVVQEYSGSKLLKDVQDENNKKIDAIIAEIRLVEDKQHQSHLKHQRFLNEAKKSILDRLFGA